MARFPGVPTPGLILLRAQMASYGPKWLHGIAQRRERSGLHLLFFGVIITGRFFVCITGTGGTRGLKG